MRKPPGFRGEEVCAEECNQPDKHENSQAHLPDLRGSWIRTPQPKQTCGWLKSLSHSRLRIFKCRLPIGYSLPKSASAEGHYSVNLRASVVKSKNAKEFHRSRTRHPLRSPAEEFLLRLRDEQS